MCEKTRDMSDRGFENDDSEEVGGRTRRLRELHMEDSSAASLEVERGYWLVITRLPGRYRTCDRVKRQGQDQTICACVARISEGCYSRL